MQIHDITPQREQTDIPIRLAAYCRVSRSTEDQLHSFAAQIRYYREYERSHPEYRLVDIYADEGLTGTCMDKRDELNRMLRDCQRGLIDRVITKSVSRLARNTQDILNIVRTLKNIGVSIYFEEQRIDSNAMNMEIMLTLPGLIAQQESLAISHNMRWSYRKRMASGNYQQSSPPYGYIIAEGKLEVYEPEAMIVRRIFDMYLQGIGKCQIARILNSEGIPSHQKKGSWHFGTINYILSNERYIGDAILQKRYTTEDLPFRRVKNHGEQPRYYVERSNPPIISRNTWEAVQKLLAEKKRESPEIRIDDTLKTILICSDCGKAFIRKKWNDNIRWINKCSFTEARRCSVKSVREEAVYDAFAKLVLKLKNHSREIVDEAIRQTEILLIMSQKSGSRISDIDSEIARLSSQRIIIARLYSNGILQQSEYTAQSGSIDARITELRTERRRKMTDDDEQLADLKDLKEALQDTGDQWNCDYGLFQQIVEAIEVISYSALRFRLIGGLEFTEYIDERDR